jgi:tRNA pseudouridine38-40 synthase
MQRFAVGIEFCGIRYKGWQTQQAGVRSLQETIETVLTKIADEPIILHGAGRTDAGVHATNMVAHFDTHAIRPERGWLMGANSQLPKDIAIQWIKPMGFDFHARFKAQSRRYRYVVYHNSSRPALLYKQVTHAYYPLDVDRMIEAAKKFEGTHNFESFRAAACQSTCAPCQSLSFNSSWQLFGVRYSSQWLFASYGAKYYGLFARNWARLL